MMPNWLTLFGFVLLSEILPTYHFKQHRTDICKYCLPWACFRQPWSYEMVSVTLQILYYRVPLVTISLYFLFIFKLISVFLCFSVHTTTAVVFNHLFSSSDSVFFSSSHIPFYPLSWNIKIHEVYHHKLLYKFHEVQATPRRHIVNKHLTQTLVFVFLLAVRCFGRRFQLCWCMFLRAFETVWMLKIDVIIDVTYVLCCVTSYIIHHSSLFDHMDL